MHNYSTDTNDLVILYNVSLVAYISFLVAVFTIPYLFQTNVTINIAIAILTLSISLNKFHQIANYLWHDDDFRFIFGIKTPNLSGTWIGYYIRTESKEDTNLKAVKRYSMFNIKQDAYKFQLEGFSQIYSRTYSISSYLDVDSTNDGCILFLNYKNEVRPSLDPNDKNMSNEAFSRNRVTGNSLEGIYFSSTKGRLTSGIIYLVKVEKDNKEYEKIVDDFHKICSLTANFGVTPNDKPNDPTIDRLIESIKPDYRVKKRSFKKSIIKLFHKLLILSSIRI